MGCISHAAEVLPAQKESSKIERKELPPLKKNNLQKVRIGQIVSGNGRFKMYPAALYTLIKAMNKVSSVNLDPDPLIIDNFENEDIFNCPFIYVNFVDRQNWIFSDLERTNLKKYLENGGFIYIDAGINSAFLRKNSKSGQSHSFADWDVMPVLKEEFAKIFSNSFFRPLPRSHKIFSTFYKGLPDPTVLPETVREFVTKEKWPQGTYSSVGLKVKGRLAVLCTPILAMGWAKNSKGQWRTKIQFRIREKNKGLKEYLEVAQSRDSYEANREDGAKDIIYTKSGALPDWVQETEGTWRVFRYYSSQTISDFAHQFYTQLGINIITYSLTH